MKHKSFFKTKLLATVLLASVFFIFPAWLFILAPAASAADIDAKAQLEIPRTTENSEAPGTVKYIGADKTEPVVIEVIKYNSENFEELKNISPAETKSLLEDGFVTWINIKGVHDEQLLEAVGSEFGLSSLVLEDIANTTQRPEYEEFDDYLFMIFKLAYTEAAASPLKMEQVSLVLGNNYVITFQESPAEIFDGIKNRIRRGQGKVREMGSDYLTGLIFDRLVDNYFPALEKTGEQIETLEEEILADPSRELLTEIYLLKQELTVIRQAIWPLRDIANSLQKTDHQLITPAVRPFFADIYQNIDQIVESVEIFRQLESEMLTLYDSILSNRTNQVMKILTIFSAIFIPLTFVTGIYGMNFKRLPGIQSRRGHVFVFFIMVALAVVMLIFFISLNWI